MGAAAQVVCVGWLGGMWIGLLFNTLSQNSLGSGCILQQQGLQNEKTWSGSTMNPVPADTDSMTIVVQLVIFSV